MKDEKGDRSLEEKSWDLEKESKRLQLRSFGGGLGDATVPQRGFGGECPQGSDLVSLRIHMTNHPITNRKRKDRDRQTNQLHPSRFLKIENNNLPRYRNQRSYHHQLHLHHMLPKISRNIFQNFQRNQDIEKQAKNLDQSNAEASKRSRENLQNQKLAQVKHCYGQDQNHSNRQRSSYQSFYIGKKLEKVFITACFSTLSGNFF